MGRDNSQKERQKKQLERRQARRVSYDRILIVSEGSETEPNYFEEIRKFYRLHTASVVVQPSELGTAPIQVVKYAKKLFENGDPHKNIRPRAFERVYAIFDRDDHDSYFNALQLAESLDHKIKNDIRQYIDFRAIASVPSFELWLLLHFEDIQAPISRTEVMNRLKTHIPHYVKGTNDSFACTRNYLEIANARAERLAVRFTAYDAPEPFTEIFKLVANLTTLRS
ncbi:RloB family protein [Nitrosomonas sp. Is24]|uniref:RloB family protein n=1 Tax=Nitrosomonas sp. Is24 TaxID=3080533 RepID=UPI00294B3AEE|nr:RloB family protein [Nitrosomonas sp. Is24]MDV6341137.1 RloB family protein [Nitrosomonas sp. Is24]